jgi:hypothetical protein
MGASLDLLLFAECRAAAIDPAAGLMPGACGYWPEGLSRDQSKLRAAP